MSALIALLLASSLDKEPIKKIFVSANPGYRRCSEATPGIEGRAVLKLSVSATGRVDEVEVTFPAEAPQFTQCLRDVTLKLRFPRGPAPYKLVWPIVFRGE